MKRRRQPADEPELFDLPLSDEPMPETRAEEPPPRAPEPPAPLGPESAPARTVPRGDDDELPHFSEGVPWLDETREIETDLDGSPAGAELEAEEDLTGAAGVIVPPEPAEPTGAAPLALLVAGLLDLGVLVAVGVAVWVGLRWMGVEPSLDDWPAAVAFHLAFSFLYFVLPLAFWGRTPGMARTGLVARTPEGDHLSFGQAIARWAGALATAGLLGVPLLLSLTGRSLSDRLSGTRTT